MDASALRALIEGVLDWYDQGWPYAPCDQLVFGLHVTGEPNSVFVSFATLFPTVAYYEVWEDPAEELALEPTYVTGKLALAGGDQTRHRARLDALAQDNGRYSVRLLAGGGTSRRDAETTRSFATIARSAQVSIDRIEILNDSDAGGAGETTFRLDAARTTDGRWAPAVSVERYLPTNDDFEPPSTGGILVDPFPGSHVAHATDQFDVSVGCSEDDSPPLFGGISFLVLVPGWNRTGPAWDDGRVHTYHATNRNVDLAGAVQRLDLIPDSARQAPIRPGQHEVAFDLDTGPGAGNLWFRAHGAVDVVVSGAQYAEQMWYPAPGFAQRHQHVSTGPLQSAAAADVALGRPRRFAVGPGGVVLELDDGTGAGPGTTPPATPLATGIDGPLIALDGAPVVLVARAQGALVLAEAPPQGGSTTWNPIATGLGALGAPRFVQVAGGRAYLVAAQEAGPDRHPIGVIVDPGSVVKPAIDLGRPAAAVRVDAVGPDVLVTAVDAAGRAAVRRWRDDRDDRWFELGGSFAGPPVPYQQPGGGIGMIGIDRSRIVMTATIVLAPGPVDWDRVDLLNEITARTELSDPRQAG